VTGHPAGNRGAGPERRLATNRRSGSSRFPARNRPAAAAPAPPVALARSPRAASAQDWPTASGLGRAGGRAGDPAADRPCPSGRPLPSDHCADRSARRAATPATGHLAGPGAPAGDRSPAAPAAASRPAGRAAPASRPSAAGTRRASRPAGRAAPASRPSAAGTRRAGRPADRCASAAGRPADHAPCPVSQAGAAADRSTGHPAGRRRGTAGGRTRNRNARAPPRRDPDTDCRSAHAAGTSGVRASLRSACCAPSPAREKSLHHAAHRRFAAGIRARRRRLASPRQPSASPAAVTAASRR
jgi:hypothetical protein